MIRSFCGRRPDVHYSHVNEFRHTCVFVEIATVVNTVQECYLAPLPLSVVPPLPRALALLASI
jgi:hypothetical protein